MKQNFKALLLLAIVVTAGVNAAVGAEGDREVMELEAIRIIGEQEDLLVAPGAAHVIDDEELENFKYNDVHRVLSSVPGVYIREEDGYGLRPNIGIRGANSDRSSKVSLMEDGILLAPAPYAAPAAYYFPTFDRITSVEVFKGPASIKYGPYTVGGAINLVTRPIPVDSSGGIDLEVGQEDFGKLYGHYGNSTERFGMLVEGVHLESSGFKDLDGGGDTGFDKNDATVKARVNSDPGDPVYQELELKLGYADEVSNESYLGLIDADFEATPYRRYAASQLDRFEWDRQQYQLSHYINWGANYDLTTTVYRHDFERVWGKLNGFETDDLTLNDIFADPDSAINSIFVDVLRGERDSLSDPETLVIGTNDREYYSQGVQLAGNWWPTLGRVEHNVELGLRYHEDQIVRRHTEDGFLMQSGRLVSDQGDTDITADETGSAEAIAVYVHDEFTLGKFTLSGGARTELIDTKLVDRLSGTTTDNSTNVLLPGAGVFYQMTPSFGLLAGVHKGFAPNAPGESDGADPEESINYEAGFRFTHDAWRAEVIGFYNDYSNLLGRCTFSSGCDEAQLDDEFNGGEADIVGAETSFGYEFSVDNGLHFPVSLVYTYTDAEFQNTFASDFSQFGGDDGVVVAGDKLPYLPAHQATLRLGVNGSTWEVNFSAKYTGEMRDSASQGDVDDVNQTDPQAIVDLAGSYNVTENGQVYIGALNVFDEADIVSRRPFGARPGRPRQFTIGYKYEF
ncbi:MAG: TonB-dependent receptor [Gammaproteobacteria bacterium]|nr:TonB-dependent receptor [Gammaproteobacteria bacterium]